MRKLSDSRGYTLLEMLIAVTLTSMLAAAGFEFYERMHSQTVTQEEISYMQQSCRASLQEISRTLRMAGYKVGSHAPYAVRTDSLYIFFSETQPVDTVLYYLEDYSQAELGAFYSSFEGQIPHKLMKKVNSEPGAVFADYIRSMSVTAINSSTLQIALLAQTSLPDDSYSLNNGFRTHLGLERVILRNVAL